MNSRRIINYNQYFLRNKCFPHFDFNTFVKFNNKNFSNLHLNSFEQNSLFCNFYQMSNNLHFPKENINYEINENMDKNIEQVEKAEFLNKTSKLAKKKRSKRKHGKKTSLRYR